MEAGSIQRLTWGLVANNCRHYGPRFLLWYRPQIKPENRIGAARLAGENSEYFLLLKSRPAYSNCRKSWIPALELPLVPHHRVADAPALLTGS